MADAKHVMIVAGEASGDQHAAYLVENIRRQAPNVRVSGIGGHHMREAGVEVLVDSSELAVVGLVEPLLHFRTIYGALQLMRRRLREERPDLLILTDYPDFNLRLARTAKELGIKVLYYISPQVWAWRQKRVFKIKELVDMMAVVFAFEVPFYEKAGVPVRFVGHPLVDEVGSELSRDAAVSALGLDPTRKVLGLFPGSRRSELKRLLPTLLQSAALLHRRFPELQFVLPRASTLSKAQLAPYLEGSTLPISVVEGRFYDTVQACDAIVTASGTATLEIALMGKPLAVIYRVSPMSYRIMSRLIKVDHIALCNIVAGKRAARELIQDDATPEAIAEEASRLLEENDYAEQVRKDLRDVRKNLGDGGGSRNIANLALEMLEP
jgi:lipid-A-disaccharide synthase